MLRPKWTPERRLLLSMTPRLAEIFEFVLAAKSCDKRAEFNEIMGMFYQYKETLRDTGKMDWLLLAEWLLGGLTKNPAFEAASLNNAALDVSGDMNHRYKLTDLAKELIAIKELIEYDKVLILKAKTLLLKHGYQVIEPSPS